MPNLTSLMECVPSLDDLFSRLSVVDRCTFRRGVTIQTFEKQGSDSMIGRRVPEQGCTCVGRLVWSTITVEESSCRSLRSHKSQARRTDPMHPTKGFHQIGGCPEPMLNIP